MKVILSRKGFDSANGGYPSPIMPDGTLLSMPIPSEGDQLKYSDLYYSGESYASILNKMYPDAKKNWAEQSCHNDPDIRMNRDFASKNQVWRPAFGQISSAQGVLKNAGVQPGDLFLFFGWFRKINEQYQFYYSKISDFYDCANLQVIFGYMEIGEIITDPKRISTYSSHPHAKYEGNNTLYIPTEKLSFNPNLDGYGTLSYRKDRVLTKEGCSRSVWEEKEFLMPSNIYGKRKNSAKKSGLYYAGIWQELVVINESKTLLDWVKSIINP